MSCRVLLFCSVASAFAVAATASADGIVRDFNGLKGTIFSVGGRAAEGAGSVVWSVDANHQIVITKVCNSTPNGNLFLEVQSGGPIIDLAGNNTPPACVEFKPGFALPADGDLLARSTGGQLPALMAVMGVIVEAN